MEEVSIYGRKLEVVFFLAAPPVCSDFASLPLVLAICFPVFWGRGFRSHRAPIIGSHALACALFRTNHAGLCWRKDGMASNGFMAKIM